MRPDSAALMTRYSMAAPLEPQSLQKKVRRQKKGRRSRGSSGPVNRTSLPDWEESVPNPAQGLDSSQRLNEALMARGDRAVGDPVRLQHIIERQSVGDSLGGDAQRARGEQVDFAVAEPRRTAIVIDHARRPRLADRAGAAALGPVLEASQQRGISKTLADRRCGSRNPADLPQPRLRLRETGGRRLRRGERKHR